MPLPECTVRDRPRNRDVREIARAFPSGIAVGLYDALKQICETHRLDPVVLSGGVYQSSLLMQD